VPFASQASEAPAAVLVQRQDGALWQRQSRFDSEASPQAGIVQWQDSGSVPRQRSFDSILPAPSQRARSTAGHDALNVGIGVRLPGLLPFLTPARSTAGREPLKLAIVGSTPRRAATRHRLRARPPVPQTGNREFDAPWRGQFAGVAQGDAGRLKISCHMGFDSPRPHRMRASPNR
jgi:hypothetical protein